MSLNGHTLSFLLVKYLGMKQLNHMTAMGVPGDSAVKNLPIVQELQETWAQSLGWEDPPEEDTATHFTILAWRIPMDRGA